MVDAASAISSGKRNSTHAGLDVAIVKPPINGDEPSTVPVGPVRISTYISDGAAVVRLSKSSTFVAVIAPTVVNDCSGSPFPAFEGNDPKSASVMAPS